MTSRSNRTIRTSHGAPRSSVLGNGRWEQFSAGSGGRSARQSCCCRVRRTVRSTDASTDAVDDGTVAMVRGRSCGQVDQRVPVPTDSGPVAMARDRSCGQVDQLGPVPTQRTSCHGPGPELRSVGPTGASTDTMDQLPWPGAGAVVR